MMRRQTEDLGRLVFEPVVVGAARGASRRSSQPCSNCSCLRARREGRPVRLLGRRSCSADRSRRREGADRNGRDRQRVDRPDRIGAGVRACDETAVQVVRLHARAGAPHGCRSACGGHRARPPCPADRARKRRRDVDVEECGRIARRARAVLREGSRRAAAAARARRRAVARLGGLRSRRRIAPRRSRSGSTSRS